MLFAVPDDDDFVQMPFVAKLRSAATDLTAVIERAGPIFGCTATPMRPRTIASARRGLSAIPKATGQRSATAASTTRGFGRDLSWRFDPDHGRLSRRSSTATAPRTAETKVCRENSSSRKAFQRPRQFELNSCLQPALVANVVGMPSLHVVSRRGSEAGALQGIRDRVAKSDV